MVLRSTIEMVANRVVRRSSNRRRWTGYVISSFHFLFNVHLFLLTDIAEHRAVFSTVQQGSCAFQRQVGIPLCLKPIRILFASLQNA